MKLSRAFSILPALIWACAILVAMPLMAEPQRAPPRSQKPIVRATSAQELYNQGRLAEAYAIAARLANREGGQHWLAGLSAWRLGQKEAAFAHFRQASNQGTDNSQRSAAAFWGGRAALATDRPDDFVLLMEQAQKEEPFGFYGQLAAAALGEDPQISGDGLDLVWRDDPALTELANRLGQMSRAEAERSLIASARGQSVDDMRRLSGMAEALSLPNAQLALGRRMAKTHQVLSIEALYPIPAWTPPDGFRMEAAVVYAVMRHESAFRTDARNPRTGASGAMQIMPRTAQLLHRLAPKARAKDISAGARDAALGDAYLAHLRDLPLIRGNLFYMLIAYNAGPGRLGEWLRLPHLPKDDPLLFIESLPSAETRRFVEDIAGATWLYRLRLQLDNPDTITLLEGRWPILGQGPF